MSANVRLPANTNDGLATARARARVGGRRPKPTEDQAALAQQFYDAREKTARHEALTAYLATGV